MGFLVALGLLILGAVAAGGSSNDPPMSPDVAANFNAMMTNPNISPAMLEAAAVSFDTGGFPNAANKLRARASQLRAMQGGNGVPFGGGLPGTTPPGMPPGMPGMPPGTPPGMPPMTPLGPGAPVLPADLQAMANQLLASNDPNDAGKLETAATGLDLAGFHALANQMRARALVLRTSPPGAVPPPAIPTIPTAGVYTIKSGDSGSAIARKFTGDAGRWRELLASNPTLKVVQTENANGPVTLIKPFNPGQTLKLPADWPPTPQF